MAVQVKQHVRETQELLEGEINFCVEVDAHAYEERVLSLAENKKSILPGIFSAAIRPRHRNLSLA